MVCNKEQQGMAVSLDRRIGAQSLTAEGKRKAWKCQCGGKEDTHQPFVPKGIQGEARKKHPLEGMLRKQWPQGRARFPLELEELRNG